MMKCSTWFATVALVCACNDARLQMPGQGVGEAGIEEWKAPAVGKLAVDPSLPKLTKTGAADFEVVERNGMFTLRDDAYEIVFPGMPRVTSIADDGVWFPRVVATMDSLNVSFSLGPTDSELDETRALTLARDRSLGVVDGKVLDDTDANVGGIPGRHVIASAESEGSLVHLEELLAWDHIHHVMVLIVVAEDSWTLTPGEREFLASFKVNPQGNSPPR